MLRQTLGDYALQGCSLYIFAESKKQMERLHEILRTTFDAALRDDSGAPRTSPRLREPLSLKGMGDAPLHEGFVDGNLGIYCFTNHQMFERFHEYNLKSGKIRPGKITLTLKEPQKVKLGNFIVYVDFGINKFRGLMKVSAGNTYQGTIHIIYQRGDTIDVSIHALYRISKYRRGDTDEPPHLPTLGTDAWERLKERIKRRTKDIVRDLIKLYTKCRYDRGSSFSADNYMQYELETSFSYEDTLGQVKATAGMKTGMEKAHPMDRLVCGDIGSGETEVTIRTTFKAACDSKQVAVLMPAVVLAFQYYKAFQGRLHGMPVQTDYLSRARGAKQTRWVLENLTAGRIDIIIGIHKLIGKLMRWHDLGLLVIDEE